MSDNDKSGASPNGAAPQFSERELQLLGWAMQSLKSGPPDIDYDTLAKFAGMGNPRSASNAWAKIRNKLMTGPDGAVPATPKKGGAKKKTTAKDQNGEEGEDTPKKTPRKRAAKKQDVNGDASPKKKGRGKNASDDDAHVKSESDDFEDLKPNGSPIKAESEESVEDAV